MSEQSFQDLIRIIAMHADHDSDTADTAPTPVDPGTVDVGESRPVTLEDVLALEAIRATDDDHALQKMARIAQLVQQRTQLPIPRLVGMPFEDYNLMVSRVVADIMPKIKAANLKVEAYNLFRAASSNGGAH